ncbi:MAG: Gfo/Idh/MocA family oxidoreductase [Vampirovibrionales bacterium]|nr:Gfo/Idh/MocA family oxidoreductase [Vampirovibrionales bacterium]
MAKTRTKPQATLPKLISNPRIQKESGKVRIGVVGVGYWGPNIIRNLLANDQCELIAICDLDPNKLAHIERQLSQHHSIRLTPAYDDLLFDPTLDGIAIVTEIPSHYELAKNALEAGKHVFVEKPLTLNSKTCLELGQLAQRVQRTLMVGHTFIYNPALTKLKEIVTGGELGDIYYLHAQRLNLGRVQTHVNALWSLAVHDVAIALHLFEETPQEVSCWGQSFITPGIEDVVFVNLQFPSGRVAHLHASWLDPEKRRLVTLVGRQKMVVYDDTSLDRKIALYDKGVELENAGELPHPQNPLLKNKHPEYTDFSGFQVLTRVGDVTIPKLHFEEPLKIEMQHFIDCINGSISQPLTGWTQGHEVVRVLETAQASLKQEGKKLPLAR